MSFVPQQNSLGHHSEADEFLTGTRNSRIFLSFMRSSSEGIVNYEQAKVSNLSARERNENSNLWGTARPPAVTAVKMQLREYHDRLVLRRRTKTFPIIKTYINIKRVRNKEAHASSSGAFAKKSLLELRFCVFLSISLSWRSDMHRFMFNIFSLFVSLYTWDRYSPAGISDPYLFAFCFLFKDDDKSPAHNNARESCSFVTDSR